MGAGTQWMISQFRLMALWFLFDGLSGAHWAEWYAHCLDGW
jgi:hypothetical protein